MRACLADRDGLRRGDGRAAGTLEAYALERPMPRRDGPARTLDAGLGVHAIPAEELARITVPTTLIWGREDRQVRLGVAEEAARASDGRCT